ncbi:hypothetical protein L9F63_001778 [Diploptera punctata]|uniref:Bifunctional coenzyme A synthase n=1 Tax=Diploptera punctata TaxID=6984 RepID=A0AAD8A480_DIPPU|nr:hypothetical protein L9F63_001778 [Diploptera punctata]
MAKIGLLVLTNPTKFGRLLPEIKQHVNKTLYIQLCPGNRLSPPSTSGDTVVQGFHYSPSVNRIYSQASSFCQNLDVRVLLASLKNPLLTTIHTRKPIEIVIFDQVFNNEEVDNFIKSCLLNATQRCQIVTINASEEPSNESDMQMPCTTEIASPIRNHSIPNKYNKMHENVVLGGTFDRLHAGHKILLSEAVLRCTKQLTVGVTETMMLKSKVLWEMIQPCPDRMSLVEDFLEDIDSSLQYDVVPIYDPFGPTKEDPTFELIVVSAETYKGGLKVNEIRQKNGLSPLEIHAVDLLSAIAEQIDDEEEEDKISSSNQRMRLLGTRLKTPEARPSLNSRPYVIGLTGSIASGKSSVSERLRKLGAGVVNCDLLGHEVYKKGQLCHELLIKEFGTEILDENREINRKALGNIVFNNKERLDKLNSLVWPHILKLAKEEINALYETGHQIIILDAAVLLQAGWDNEVHEIWTCLIPPEESVRRLQERNSLTENEAKLRIASLPSNIEFLEKANVVLCTLWSTRYTQKQVEKAWKGLELYLEEVTGKA